MQHAVTQPIPPFKTADGRLEIHGIPVWVDNLSWLAVCTRTGAAVVIDGPEAPPVLAKCAALGAELTGVLNTHVHGDHVGVNQGLAKLGLLGGLTVCGPAKQAAKVPGLTRGVGEGDRVQIGAVEGQVWLTEGHQDGHVSFVFGDALFCGDTLFAGGCGYLFDGPPAKMHASLQRLMTLDGATRAFCAHEYTQDN
ncbi:MAG: MBL fold metallo-hydrolase, partial [Myxococcales bacterium]|nr:MBL fold metallo-hydrolase [Myxococcales bacterium]